MLDGPAQFKDYADRLGAVLQTTDWSIVAPLTDALFRAWQQGSNVFFAGNGGSAGNANHITNDFLYPVSKRIGSGIRARSLSESPSVLTCLANDEGYEQVFSAQLAVLANAGDLLITLSGSGNSPNILRVLEQARQMDVTTFAILGYDGGKAKEMADHPIHFAIDDMQISEDLQMIVLNMALQHLYARRDEIKG